MRLPIVLATVALLLTPALPAAVHGEDPATRKQIEELERKQKEFSDELERLKQQVESTPAPSEPRVDEVERRQGILTEEIQRLRELLYLPESGELKSFYGLGPAASRVYGIKRGLSIGGYGEGNFKAVVHDGEGQSDTFDLLRFVLYVGYKFNDWIVINSEVEFEHATTVSTVSSGSGSVSVEFANLDLLFDPMANARFGLILVPVGFLNLVHEPPFYFGNVRPPVERAIIPTTWRSNGVGLYGELAEGLEYQAYGITSFNALGYRSSGLRDARQSGNVERANDWSFVGRLDYSPILPLDVGGSMYLGDQGQNEEYFVEPGQDAVTKAGVFTQLYEIHAQLQTGGWWFRTLGTMVHIDDAAVVSNTVGETVAVWMWGVYAEVAYNVLPLIWEETPQYLAPWFRYSWLDTNNGVPAGYPRDEEARQDFYEFGLQYKPIPEVVFKIDYHIQDAEVGILPDELRIGAGFVF